MPQFRSPLADEGRHNSLSSAAMDAPGGPLTQWHQAHPDGDPVAWHEDEATNKDLLSRFRGGPFVINQSNFSYTYDVYSRIFRCVHEGFAGITYRIAMHMGGTTNAAPTDFMVFSIDTPRAVPRTAIRPTGMLDSVKRGRGYHGMKTDDKDFDQHYHIQTEDEQFAKALLTPTFKQFIRDSPLPSLFSFIFEGKTLSTWNRWEVLSSSGDHYRLDYMSMMIDYLAQVMKASPPELWQG